ncbi:MAG: hypothetical protein GF368_05995 [Candidatus Aenigmarchaeota archaeon]|nr:hypothetical protein [Candidatus Aenigmarchaeota archaeon]
MEVKKIKEKDNNWVLELEGESKTFANLIREELWNSEGVVEAAAIQEHPYMDQPKLFLKMEGRYSHTKALEDTAKRIEIKLQELEKEFSRALK